MVQFESVAVPSTPANPHHEWGLLLRQTTFPDRSCHDCTDDELHAIYKNETHLQVTPCDPETGVTLALHPEGASREVRLFAADDHHPEHPRTHPLLQSDGGLAVRRSRMQRANYWLHHIDNHNTFRGPELPQTRDEQFKRVVYNVAGLIPERAIAFRNPGDYYLKPLTVETRLKMWEQRIIRVESQVAVRSFIKQYLFEQDHSQVPESLLDQFLYTRNPIERWKCAKQILNTAAQVVTDPIAIDFKKQYRNQLLPPTTSWRAARFVVSRLANHEGEKSTLSRDFQRVLRARLHAA